MKGPACALKTSTSRNSSSSPMAPSGSTAAELGIARPRAPLAYDGCAEWGDFEERHMAMQRGLGRRVPPLSPDAHEGAQSALLPAGTTTLFPIYFTPDGPHGNRRAAEDGYGTAYAKTPRTATD
jgi:hypothetical protein